MSTLKPFGAGVLELDSHTPREMGWLMGGCLTLLMGGLLGLVYVVEAAEGRFLSWLGAIILAMFALGTLAIWLGSQLQESYLLSARGVRRRRIWLGYEFQHHWLAEGKQIHGLALDCSERQPRSWRLMLVRNDGQCLELSGHSLKETEEQRWSEACDLGAQVAAALEVPLRLPEGIERERRMEFRAGDTPSIHYPEFLQLTSSELKEMKGLLLACVALLGLFLWFFFQGHN